MRLSDWAVCYDGYMNEQREWEAIRTAQQLYPDLPQITPVKGEKPDFRFPRTGAECLGLEVTEYFRRISVDGAPLQAQVSLTEKLLSECMALHASRGIDPRLIVSIQFRPNMRVRDTGAATVALVNALEIEAAQVPVGGEILNNGQMPSCIGKLIIYHRDKQRAPLWLNVGTAWPVPLEVTEIEAVLADKEPKLAMYHQTCAEIWLIIVVDTNRISSMAELSQTIAEETFKTGFDRVLLLHGSSAVVRLKTEPP
jgi:hypothetical protein